MSETLRHMEERAPVCLEPLVAQLSRHVERITSQPADFWMD